MDKSLFVDGKTLTTNMLCSHEYNQFLDVLFLLTRRMPQGNRSPLLCILVSGPVLNPRKAKISWGVVCRRKSECELGLKPLNEANMVSCLKLTWRLTSLQPSLWGHWVQTNLFVKETSE